MNARDEFCKATSDCTVVAASVSYIRYDQPHHTHILKKGYSSEDYEKFIDELDFEYDDGYGTQELDGMIWCEDGIWLDRGEYDGAEWWRTHQYPKLWESVQ